MKQWAGVAFLMHCEIVGHGRALDGVWKRLFAVEYNSPTEGGFGNLLTCIDMDSLALCIDRMNYKSTASR